MIAIYEHLSSDWNLLVVFFFHICYNITSNIDRCTAWFYVYMYISIDMHDINISVFIFDENVLTSTEPSVW